MISRTAGGALVRGALFGACYFAVELLSAVLVVRWAGGAVGIFRILAPELLRFLAGYLALGAACGIPASLAAFLARRWLPRLAAGPGADFFFLAVAFSTIAWLWNPESYLPRYAYGLIAFAASAPPALLTLAGRWISRRGRPGARFRHAAAAAAAIGLAATMLVLAPRREPDPPAAPAASGPNVLLIVVDTLRRDRVSAHGYARDTTPAIDRLAREGALFENATTTETWTLPAHASLFTGLYPREHQAHIAHPFLDGKHRTLAERLRDAGYLTAGVSANPWVSRAAGLDQGFDELRYVGVETTTGFLFLSLFASRFVESDLGARAVTREVLRLLTDAASGQRPFFLFANYMEAHEPYGSFPEPHFSRFLEEPLPRDIGQRWVRDTLRFQCLSCSPDPELEAEGLRCREGRWRAAPERLDRAVALYDAGVRYVDHHIGRVYEKLQELSILDQTLVIVTSDHGESLGERGQMGHGAFLYQSVLEVPLVMRYPAVFPAGSRVPEPVSLVDVLPTVEDVLSLPSRAGLGGRSLVPGRTGADRIGAFAEYVPYATDRVWKRTSRLLDCDFRAVGRASASLQIGPWKLIRSADGSQELFDLESSPREEDDLSGRRPELERTLEAALASRIRSLTPGTADGPAPEMDDATLRALKSLGYVP